MVADRRGVTTTFALMNLQERGTLIIGPAEEVYEGMIVGENARAEEMDVNPTKEKKLNNIRSATAEDFERLTPAMSFSLEHALEFISRGRVRRGHAEGGAAAQGDPGPGDPGAAAQPGPGRPGARRGRIEGLTRAAGRVGGRPAGASAGIGGVGWPGLRHAAVPLSENSQRDSLWSSDLEGDGPLLAGGVGRRDGVGARCDGGHGEAPTREHPRRRRRG